MPYSLSLRNYVLPEFEAAPPREWERRLRDISPILPNTSHLRFRKFEPREDWKESLFNTQPDRPLWAIYTCLPIRLVEPMTAEGFRKHWSEYLSKEDESQGRLTGEAAAIKAMVSDYQHFMWHSCQLYVKPFWLLQGEWGGTPSKYTDRERRYLDASGESSIPAPPGAFTPCPFNELAVQKILERDRFMQAGNRFDVLEKMDRPEAKKAEDDAAELVHREEVLKHLSRMSQPAVEFLKSQIGKREMDDAVASGFLRPAPDGLTNTLATFREVFLETGQMPGVTAPKQRTRDMAVA